MSITPEKLEKLEEIISKGELEVEYQDRKVRYRPLSEMLKARTLVRKILGLRKKRNKKYAEFSKGLS